MIEFFDDSFDIGKEPLPMVDPELKTLYDHLNDELLK